MKVRKATGLSPVDAKRFAQTAQRELLQRILRAAEYQQSGRLHDPIEDDPDHAAVIADASRRAEIETNAELAKMIVSRGRARAIWRKKKQILADQGLLWFSPGEMNPGTVFD